MLEVKTVTKRLKEFPLIKKMLKTDFPPAEQAPRVILMNKAKKSYTDFLAYYDNGIFVGFTYLITNKDITYLLYFAVCEDLRSKGYGAVILNYLHEKFKHNRIFLNIEEVKDGAPNPEQRIRRRNFYIKHGYESFNSFMSVRGESYEVLTYGGNVAVSEQKSIFKLLAGKALFPFIGFKLGQNRQ
ncbi:MAG: GNAT family N-acetyltransferase [Firmicutes bacterium]|nr:GNAT family N-acetyltransferase [Bacillota bacterium]